MLALRYDDSIKPIGYDMRIYATPFGVAVSSDRPWLRRVRGVILVIMVMITADSVLWLISYAAENPGFSSIC